MIKAVSCRRSAYLFNWGNLLATTWPLPFLPLWFGAGVMVFAFNRRHPDPRVGYYTRRAATRFYGLAGIFIVVGKLYPAGDDALTYFLGTWLLANLIMWPWTLWDLSRIWHEPWQDLPEPDPDDGVAGDTWGGDDDPR